MGKWPSVTQVLGCFVDYSGINQEVLASAIRRGTAVHRVCTAIAAGYFVVVDVDPEHQGYIESFRRWWPLVDEAVLVEAALEDPTHGYIGHPDLVVRMKGEVFLRVVDLKTPVTRGRTWRGQVAAYNNLAALATGQMIRRSGCLRLDKGGGAPSYDSFDDERVEDFAVFLSALQAYQHYKWRR